MTFTADNGIAVSEEATFGWFRLSMPGKPDFAVHWITPEEAEAIRQYLTREDAREQAFQAYLDTFRQYVDTAEAAQAREDFDAGYDAAIGKKATT